MFKLMLRTVNYCVKKDMTWIVFFFKEMKCVNLEIIKI